MINDRQITKRISLIFRRHEFYVFLGRWGEEKLLFSVDRSDFQSIYILWFRQNLRTIASIFTTQLNLCWIISRRAARGTDQPNVFSV